VGAFIHPVPVASFIAYWALPLLAVLTLIMTGVLMRRWTVPKLFGALMLLLYAGFLGVMWLA
jgi:Ca2+/Na+ antiporter